MELNFIFFFVAMLMGFGFIACSIFKLTNYFYSDQNVKTEYHQIIERTFIRGTTKYKIGKDQTGFALLLTIRILFAKLSTYTTTF